MIFVMNKMAALPAFPNPEVQPIEPIRSY